MTCRENDPADFDPAPHRTSELGVSWNGKAIRARGLGVFLALAVLAVVGAQLYTGWRIEASITMMSRDKTAEHVTLRTSQDRTSCIVAMTADQRDEFRKSYAPGAFRRYCPWVEE